MSKLVLTFQQLNENDASLLKGVTAAKLPALPEVGRDDQNW